MTSNVNNHLALPCNKSVFQCGSCTKKVKIKKIESHKKKNLTIFILFSVIFHIKLKFKNVFKFSFSESQMAAREKC